MDMDKNKPPMTANTVQAPIKNANSTIPGLLRRIKKLTNNTITAARKARIASIRNIS